MKLRYRFANQVVGFFVLLALALTIALLVLMGANQRWFKKNYVYHAQFTTASDLSVGMPVTFRGFEIGKLTGISLTEENIVEIDFFIQEEYIDKLHRDSLIQLVSSPLGGGQIVLHQGREVTPPLPEQTMIPIYESKQGVRLRDENRVIVVRNTDAIAQALSQIDPILLNVDRVLTNVASLTSEIELALKGESDGPISGTLAGLDRAVSRLQGTITQVNNVIDNTASQVDGLFDQVDEIAANLQQTTAALTDPTGLVTRLLDPKGSVATLLDDDNQLFDRVTGIVDSLQTSISSLQGSIAEVQKFTSYLNTTQPQISSLLEEGRQTLTTGQDVLEGLRNNPLLRGGIPEAREQPTTFRSIRDEEF